MNKNKLSSVAAASVTPRNSGKTLRDGLRRVMSDRVMKITRCSQQQNVEKVKQKMVVDLLTSAITTPVFSGSATSSQIAAAGADAVVQMITSPDDFTQSQPATTTTETVMHAVRSHISPNMIGMTPKMASDLAQRLVNKDPSPLLAKIGGAAKLSPQLISAVVAANAIQQQNHVTKISLQPIKQFDLKDKESLIKHVKTVYDDVQETSGSLVMAAQSITNSISHYVRANQLDLKTTCADIFKEHLLKTTIQLKQKYQNQPGSEEKLKLEAQLQVLLQIEHYIIENSNPLSNKIKVDEDWIWEIANYIRWISQTFRDKFKIERFILGEIDSNYIAVAPDFIVGLKEELGYDKQDTDSDSSSSSDDDEGGGGSGSKMTMGDSANSSTIGRDESVVVSKFKLVESMNTSTMSASLNYTRDEMSTTSFSLVNSLFEDVNERNSFETDNNYEEEPSHSQKNSVVDDDDPLNSFIKKKPVNRFTDLSSSSMRSIVVVQPRKRMRLKMRSPYKSPSKALAAKRLAQDLIRRSPRIKEKQTSTLLSDSPSGKRRKSYLITDTPDHKQNATIMTIRQEKVRKRFFTQQQHQSPLPVIPDTPVKKS